MRVCVQRAGALKRRSDPPDKRGRDDSTQRSGERVTFASKQLPGNEVAGWDEVEAEAPEGNGGKRGRRRASSSLCVCAGWAAGGGEISMRESMPRLSDSNPSSSSGAARPDLLSRAATVRELMLYRRDWLRPTDDRQDGGDDGNVQQRLCVSRPFEPRK